ncbi:helix-turn-helix transcriptional regulator [Streptomyces sp. NPDC007856]|uniref:helix-turn-helix transcriptional regulator n=1 Tax=Streptomyces sp. NPDC007856 TaxID=3364781 RepID=UPI0036CB738A
MVLAQRHLEGERHIQTGGGQRHAPVQSGTGDEHHPGHRHDRHRIGPAAHRDPVPPLRQRAAQHGADGAAEIEHEQRGGAGGRASSRALLGVQGQEGAQPDDAVLLDQLRVSPQQPLHLPTTSAPLLRALCDILRADPADARTLAELGREVGASDRTLSRLFRGDLGMTFPQWRTQLRLHHALVLLAERTPVTTVAHRCGWSSASAFIDVFRRTFGHTPGSRPAEHLG